MKHLWLILILILPLIDNCEKDNLSHFIKTTAEFFNLGKNISPCFSGMWLYGEKTDA